ncbi:hypothetical protein scyTo_0001185 [Scyliorhinus torazame]|uniref:Uncharacterized protein n=1 Tax=Scyliorhinus torazame TaxID=75743 RepID=A0A401PAE1_SCYTO|nr:hypothetical protein [Scyliorhinus torazame]
MLEWTKSTPELLEESPVNLYEVEDPSELQDISLSTSGEENDRSAGEVSFATTEQHTERMEGQASLPSNIERATVDNTPATAFATFPEEEVDSIDLESLLDSEIINSTGHLSMPFPSSKESDSLLSNIEGSTVDNTPARAFGNIPGDPGEEEMDSIDLESSSDSRERQVHRICICAILEQQ